MLSELWKEIWGGNLNCLLQWQIESTVFLLAFHVISSCYSNNGQVSLYVAAQAIPNSAFTQLFEITGFTLLLSEMVPKL